MNKRSFYVFTTQISILELNFLPKPYSQFFSVIKTCLFLYNGIEIFIYTSNVVYSVLFLWLPLWQPQS